MCKSVQCRRSTRRRPGRTADPAARNRRRAVFHEQAAHDRPALSLSARLRSGRAGLRDHREADLPHRQGRQGRQAPRLADGDDPRHPRPHHRPLDGIDPGDLREGPEAGLLPVARIPDRPADARRRHQHGTHGGDARGAGPPRRRPRRGGLPRAGRRARQWRPRAPRRLLHGIARHRRRPRLRLRHPLRPRPLPPADAGRLAGGAARDVARPRQPLGVRAPRKLLRDRLRRQRRDHRRRRRRHRALHLAAPGARHRHRLRHARGRLARQAGQHAPALDRAAHRPDPARRLQRRRPHRRA